MYNPEEYFDLSEYNHKTLFEDVEFIWEVLAKIKPYLSEKPLGELCGDISDKAYIIHPEQVFIGTGTVVEPGAYIHGPCIIGNHCIVRHGAYIRGYLITGDHCVIGHDTEIKNSIFLNHTHAAHFAYVGDSILGNHVNLGAGTKCANLKINRSNVSVDYMGKKMDTGLRKFGAVLGDRVETGCNSVTNPGTIMGQGSMSYPCVNVGGVVPSNHIVKNSSLPVVVEGVFTDFKEN